MKTIQLILLVLGVAYGTQFYEYRTAEFDSAVYARFHEKVDELLPEQIGAPEVRAIFLAVYEDRNLACPVLAFGFETTPSLELDKTSGTRKVLVPRRNTYASLARAISLDLDSGWTVSTNDERSKINRFALEAEILDEHAPLSGEFRALARSLGCKSRPSIAKRRRANRRAEAWETQAVYSWERNTTLISEQDRAHLLTLSEAEAWVKHLWAWQGLQEFREPPTVVELKAGRENSGEYDRARHRIRLRLYDGGRCGLQVVLHEFSHSAAAVCHSKSSGEAHGTCFRSWLVQALSEFGSGKHSHDALIADMQAAGLNIPDKRWWPYVFRWQGDYERPSH